MGFAEELIKNRKLADLTQEELAGKCNVSRQAVAKWEKGEALPDIYTVAKLAQLFGRPIEELIWSKEYVTENKTCFIRPMQEADKEALSPVLRRLRFMGQALSALGEYATEPGEYDYLVWDGYKGWELFVICEKPSQVVAGYIAIYHPDKNMAELTIQISQPELLPESNYALIRDFLDHFAAEHGIRAICVTVHTDTERGIYESFGYTDVGDELILALPI